MPFNCLTKKVSLWNSLFPDDPFFFSSVLVIFFFLFFFFFFFVGWILQTFPDFLLLMPPGSVRTVSSVFFFLAVPFILSHHGLV